MTWLVSGIGEIQQKLYRFKLYSSEPSLQRKLAEAEYNLGVLGFQYGEECPTAQSSISKIKEIERHQLDLVNESALIGGRLTDYDAQLKKLQKEHEKALQKQVEALKPLEKRHRNIATLLERTGTKVHQLNATITEIDRTNGKSRRAEELRRERAEFQVKRGRAKIDVERIQAEEQGARAELLDAQERVSELKRAFEKAQMMLAEDIRKDAKHKQELEKKLSGMEEAKHQPFREIGRMLADAGIFPRNQPESLDKVLNLRKQLVMIDGRLEESREISRSFGRGELMAFYLLTAGILAGLVALVSWVLH